MGNSVEPYFGIIARLIAVSAQNPFFTVLFVAALVGVDVRLQQGVQILVGARGVADLELDRLPDADVVRDDERAALLLQAHDVADEEVAALEFALVLVEDASDVQAVVAAAASSVDSQSLAIAVTDLSASERFYRTVLSVFRHITPLTRFLNTPLLKG